MLSVLATSTLPTPITGTASRADVTIASPALRSIGSLVSVNAVTPSAPTPVKDTVHLPAELSTVTPAELQVAGQSSGATFNFTSTVKPWSAGAAPQSWLPAVSTSLACGSSN